MDNAFSYLTRVMNTYIIECTFNLNMQRPTTPPTLTVSAYQSAYLRTNIAVVHECLIPQFYGECGFIRSFYGPRTVSFAEKSVDRCPPRPCRERGQRAACCVAVRGRRRSALRSAAPHVEWSEFYSGRRGLRSPHIVHRRASGLPSCSNVPSENSL